MNLYKIVINKIRDTKTELGWMELTCGKISFYVVAFSYERAISLLKKILPQRGIKKYEIINFEKLYTIDIVQENLS